MKKLFVVSDIHGYASILKKSLRDAGFDPQDPAHLLICCGDCFDRGSENQAVMEYLQSIPNKVLVRGNHEDMLEQAILRGTIGPLELLNGTAGTLEEFFGFHSIDASGKLTLSNSVKSELLAFTDQMVDYFETEKYVFVHGWVPLNMEWGEMKLRPDWRTASPAAWERARFIGWNKAYKQRLTLPDKTVVCGHRGTQHGFEFDPTRSPDSCEPFYGKHLIAIDGHTVSSRQVNVLVLEDELREQRVHSMNLRREYFERIADGSKIIEMRLFDEKRRRIRIGDQIEFACDDSSGELLRTRVQGVYVYPDFDELVEDFTTAELGFAGIAKTKIVELMLRLYGVEAAYKNKAVAIKVKVI